MVCTVEYYVNAVRGKWKKSLYLCVLHLNFYFNQASVPPPAEKGPVALPGGSLVRVWLTPSTDGPPLSPGAFTQPGGEGGGMQNYR